MAEHHDYQALDWVKGEIEETLKQAQEALEAFVKNSDDSTRMRFCLAHLHQVHGTLQMVEFYGAALLAEEMEKLAQGMLDGSVNRQQDAQEVLMRAMLQLPIYLERVRAGRRDLPIVILPLLNDLRAVRGEHLLSETAMFTPDLRGGAAAVPVEEVSEEVVEQYTELLKKIRQLYQFALVGVIRGEDMPTNLGYLAKSLAKLEHMYSTTPMAQLWWVASALLEGISCKAIELGTSVKMLLGLLDRQLKHSIDTHAGRDEPLPQELLKNLLFYIARSETDTPRIRRVKDAFRLDEALPGEDAVDRERRRMSGPDKDTIVTVIRALLEEISAAKDMLDMFLRAKGQDVRQLRPMTTRLKQVADTLAVLSLGSQRRVILEQLEVMNRVIDQDALPASTTFMDVAGALLYVEATLQGMAAESHRQNALEPASESEQAPEIPADHVLKARAAVIAESRAGLEGVKEAIMEYVSAHFDPSLLTRVLALLNSVRGGLTMVPLRYPAELLQSCIQYIQNDIIQAKATPDWRVMDTLADAITSVEYYLERLDEQFPGDETILSIAEDAVASLGYPVEKAAGDAAEIPKVTLDQVRIDEEVPEFEIPELTDAVAVGTLGEGVQGARESSVVAATPAPSVPSAPPVTVATPVIVAPPAAVIEDDFESIDEEVLEIFIEEVGEVLQTIQDYLPQWREDPEDSAARTEIRRAFHTIKGSGRLVGAKVLGELSWAVENMLNRVLDRTIPTSDAVFDLVAAVIATMPAMVDAFSARRAPSAEYVPLEAAAWALARGQQIASQPASAPELSTSALSARESREGHDVTPSSQPDSTTHEAAALHAEPESKQEYEAEQAALADAHHAEEAADSRTPAQAQDTFTLSDAAFDSEGELEEIHPSAEFEPRAAFDAEAEASPSEEASVPEFELSTADAFSVSGLDPVLVEIFVSEARSHLQTVTDFLAVAGQKDAPFSADLLRALHTLKGSAHMAGITNIAELAAPAEKFIKEAHMQGLLADQEIRNFLQTFGAAIASALEQVADDTVSTLPETAGLLAKISEMRQQRLRHSEDAVAANAAARPDKQLVSLFLAEGIDLIVDAGDVLNHWEENPVPGTQLDSLRSELRVLARSASAAQLPEVVALSMALEETYSNAAEGLLVPDRNFFQIAHRAHESLVEMMDRIAVGQPAGAADEIVASLQALMDQAPEVAEKLSGALGASAQTDAPKFAPEEVVEFTGSVPQEGPENEEGPENGLEMSVALDPELVEIFLEEAADIMDSTSNLLQEWLDAPERLDTVAALQRELHTLKGGARMADIREIGDLAHHLENLYEGLAEGRLHSEPSLSEVLHQCHDRLMDMVDAVTAGKPPKSAPDLIAVIDGWMRGERSLAAATGTQPVEASPVFEREVPAMDVPAGQQEEQPQVASFEPVQPVVPEVVASAASALPPSQPVQPPSQPTQAPTPRPTQAPAAPITPAEIASALGDDVDPELLEVFFDEAEELTLGIDTCLQSWLDDRANPAHSTELQRLLHTLKGGARMAGLTLLGDLAHDFESFLTQIEAGGADITDAQFAEVQQRQDLLFDRIEKVRKGDFQALLAPLPATTAAASVSAPAPAAAAPVAVTPAPKSAAPAVAARADESGTLPPVEKPAFAAPWHEEEVRPAAVQSESIKVTAEVLESLVNLAGETSIIRGRIEQEITDFNFVISEVGQTIDRVRELLRRLDMETEAQILFNLQQSSQTRKYEDFDPLEMDRYSALHQLSRSLGESVSDLLDLRDSLSNKARDAETLLVQQARVNSELQEGLMRSRMVPFSRLAPRLRRIVRQIAGEIGKRADLEIIGADGEMDRTVMDRLVAPLEHMLRNAVDHGIELPQDRVAAGKKEQGRITLHIAREGGEVVLRLTDDGRGIALDKVKKRAIERGLMQPDAPLADKEVMQFIFRAGFSTAEKVTQISGRGVGMDVVYNDIKQLNGSIKLHSFPGAGSQFTVRLPFTVSVNRALMVKVGDDAYAIPLNNIEGIVRVSPYELESYYQPGAEEFEYAGSKYRIKYLGAFVHNQRQPNLAGITKPLPVLLIRGTDHAVALQVDALIGSREIVVKSVGPQLAAVSGLSGATILGDGSVVIILDITAMIRAEQAQISAARATHAVIAEREVLPEEESDTTPIVMVVDDSVTVRKVTSRLLERHGYEVITAKDGVDAITILQENQPDIMLLDIEMPRMDGFEVATLIRHDERLKELPIIMITSRTGEKHRDRAFSIGVDRYMGKPYQETVLLETIQELLKQRVTAQG
ncbi:putative histidine kinase related protein [gamma proteobacterium HdN1]|nr:putative histidine kinase related protein [gamma proteobacterium HdN1]